MDPRVNSCAPGMGKPELAGPDAALADTRLAIPPYQPRYALGVKSGEGRTARDWSVIVPLDVLERCFEELWMTAASAQILQRLADETGHQPGTLEKVLRLLDLLQEIARDRLLADRLVLKGGTALNLFHSASTGSRSISA